MSSYAPVKLAFNAVEPEGGASEKPPIIFAHGLSASKEHWEDLTQNVADATKRKVYAIDARNHGDSEWNDVFDANCNVDDLLHFMDSAGIPKAILVGHSMGGITGIKTALKAPERVEKLIVEEMGIKNPPKEVMGMVQMFAGMLRSVIEQMPNDLDEASARKLIFDSIISKVPEEFKNLVKPEAFENIKLKRTEDGRHTFKANIDVLERALQNASEIMTDVEGVYEGPASFVYGKLSPFLVLDLGEER